ncbi:MAG: protein kinase domain-containing protein [Actinomycetota bacterium]
MSDLTGEVIDGRYKLNRIVASGGMATIYAALDLRLDRQVAVKIMHPHLAQDEKFVERFIREAKAAASLSHPNIVAVLDQGWNQGGTPCVFIVMELIEGATLRDYLVEQGRLSIEKVLPIIMPVSSALAAAHKLGIVHRDIKPENILVSKEGRIKIADFGLARGALLGSTMTAESSVILGSVSYLSPEQVQRGIADARSDIYSLGIVLFELLTGEKPYQGEDPVQIAIRHVNDRIPAPSTLNSAITPEVDALVLRATDINPDKRPADGAAFLEELRTLSEKLDPRKRQLSLELDLPPIPIKSPVRERSKTNR